MVRLTASAARLAAVLALGFGAMLPLAAEALPAALASDAVTGSIARAIRQKSIDPVRLKLLPGATLEARYVNPESERAVPSGELKRLEPPGLPGEVVVADGGEKTVPVPRRKPPVPVIVAEKQAPPTSVSAAAESYRKFHRDLSQIAAMKLDSPKNLRKAEQLLVAYGEAALARGWIAHGAELAARSPAFSDGVRAAAVSGDKEALKASWLSQPFTALQISGSDAASQSILYAIKADSAYMDQISRRLMDIAYGRPSDEARLSNEAKGRVSPASYVPEKVPPQSGALMNAQAKPLMAQIIALGATLSLEATDGTSTPTPPSAAVNRDNDQCLRWARLNLDQCLAAAQIPSERAYCLAKHGIDERAKCWSWIADPSASP